MGFFSNLFGDTSTGYLSPPIPARAAQGNIKDAVTEYRNAVRCIKNIYQEQSNWLNEYSVDYLRPFLKALEYINNQNLDRTGRVDPTVTNGDHGCSLNHGNMPYFMSLSPFYDTNGRFYRRYGLLPYMASNGRFNFRLEVYYSPDEEHVFIDYVNNICIDWRTLTVSHMK